MQPDIDGFVAWYVWQVQTWRLVELTLTPYLLFNHLLILAIIAENKTKETIHASEHEEWKDVRVTEDVKVTEEVQVTAN